MFQFGLRFLAVRTFEIAELHDLDRSARASLHCTLRFRSELVPHRAKWISSKRNDLTNERVLQIASDVKCRPLLRRFPERNHDLSDAGHFRRSHALDLPLNHWVVAKHVMHE